LDAARSVLANLTPRGRIAVAAAGVALLVLLFLLFRMATQPSFELMMSGLDPADTGKVTASLDEQGIAYELRNNGTAVAVEKSSTADARIALAKTGMPGADKPGFELFDKQKLGTSDFQQKVNYQRALEGELARTVSQVDGVSGAQVRLTLPEDDLFSEESRKPTAAVLLNGGASGLDPGSVRGIARLVASSVEGLDNSDVTITDSSGALLWPAAGGAAGGGALSKQASEARYERELEASLDGLLLRTIGPDKGRVEVQADVNADRSTQSKLEYAKKGTPLEQHSEREQLGAGAGAAGGASGSAGNIPSYAQGGAASGSDYKRDSENTTYGVDKTVTRTQIAPGAVNRQAVALVVDDSVPASDVSQLERAVAAAAGIDAERGDTIETSRIPFAEVPEPATPGPVGGIVGYAKYVALAIGTLLFLFFAGRHLRRREQEGLDSQPVWLRELNAPATLAELEGDRFDEDRRDEQPRRDVEELAAFEPDRVAQQLRAWMKEA
jgi:flagellar M-ring protein FliF